MDIKNTRFTVLLIILGVSSVLFAAGIPDPQWNPGYDHGAARKNNTYTKAEVDDSLAEVMRTDGTNADSPVFPGPVTVNGVFTASDSAVIGTSAAQAGYDLTVASGAYLANVVATGTLTIPLVAPADPQPGMLWFEP
jgi:hypothetical protein